MGTTPSYSCSEMQDLGEKTRKTPQAKPLLTMTLKEFKAYLTKRQKLKDDENNSRT